MKPQANIASQLEAEQLAAKAIIRARIALMRSKGKATLFFVARLLNTPCEPLWSIDTAAADGYRIFYNPQFFTELPPPELQGVLLHEMAHVAFGHHLRRKGRDVACWNVACDLAINGLLEEAGIALPKGALYPGVPPYAHCPPGQNAEQYYHLVAKQQLLSPIKLPSQANGDQSLGDNAVVSAYSDPGSCGAVVEPGGGSKEALAKAEQDNRVANAVASQMAEHLGPQKGDGHSSLGRAIGQTLRNSVDWAALLRDFVIRVTQDDYSWLRPNRRLLQHDVYAPTLYQHEVGKLAILIDVSGSICHQILDTFIGEVNNLGVAVPGVAATIIYHDNAVRRVDEWLAADGAYRPGTVPGGGGTDHRPAFAEVRNRADGGEDFVAIICLTDLFSVFPRRHPELPTLWVVYNNSCPKVPWGTLAHMEPKIA